MTYDTIHMMMIMTVTIIIDQLQLPLVRCLCAAGRHFAGTALNERSSRSHVIFRIVSHLYLLAIHISVGLDLKTTSEDQRIAVNLDFA